MSNKTYDIAKWTLITFVPALILLINSLGSIYGFDTEIIISTISAISVFVGTLLGVSNANYYKKKSEKSKEVN